MKKTVGIFTNFMEFNPGYSLTGIVIDQAHMLAREGHKIVIYVNEQFNDKFNKEGGLEGMMEKFPGQIKLLKMTKFMHLTDYTEDKMSDIHKKASAKAGEIFCDSIVEEGINVVFTHDFIFTGWNLPYYHALVKANQLLNQKRIQSVWYHWVHSVPSTGRDWWSLEPLSLNHFVVFPNKTEIMRVAEAFKTVPTRVKIIPHIKDIRTWYDFCSDSMDIIERYPAIMEAQIVQVYPCSTDRLSAKQLHIVIQVFAKMKATAKVPVFLVVANQWATGKQRKEDVTKYIDGAERIGLVYGEDFIFTSEVDLKFSLGISRRILRELQLLSNIFIFPTREESFGLVGPEAAFSGALPIVNRSLIMMSEVMSNHAPAFEFGSHHHESPQVVEEDYIQAVAMACLNRIYSNEAIMTKTYCRMRYNMDSIYTRYYLPNL